MQEAEQSLPGFISSGLDFPDWVEAFAPKPYAIVSTEDDMFPFAGARQTFGEAQRMYGLYDARDRLQWITGQGGHGNLTRIALRSSLSSSNISRAATTSLRLRHYGPSVRLT